MDIEKITLENKLNELSDRLYKIMLHKKLTQEEYILINNKVKDLRIQLLYIDKLCETYEKLYNF